MDALAMSMPVSIAMMSLKFKDRLQGALADLGLVGGVAGGKFAACNQQMVDHHAGLKCAGRLPAPKKSAASSGLGFSVFVADCMKRP